MSPIAGAFSAKNRKVLAGTCGLVLVCLALTASPAFAGESPYKAPASYWYCNSTPHANTRFYSDVFQVPGSGVNYQQVTGAFEKYLSGKYGVKGSPFCHGEPDANKVRSDMQKEIAQLRNVKWSITETGWKYGGAAPAASTASASGTATLAASPQTAAAPASTGTYWVCRFGYYSKLYVSDVISPADAPGEPGQVMGELVQGFTSFLVAKYKLAPHVGSGSCIYQFSASQAQAQLNHMIKPTTGPGAIATGWKPAMKAAGGSAASPSPNPGPASAAGPPAEPPAPVQSVAAPPVTTSITVRLVDAVNSSNDAAGKHYRAVVTQAAVAGSVQIPQNTLATLTIAQQSPGMWSAQLASLKINGQDVPVTSTSVTATSQMQQVTKKFGGLLFGLSHGSFAAPTSAAVTAVGNHVMLTPGTSLTFTTSVPQSDAGNAGPGSAQSAPVPAPTSQPNGEIGPGGIVMGNTVSGVPVSYYCYLQYVFPNAHRQTSYTTGAFTSAEPQVWITFYWSEYIHETYHLPPKVSNITVNCLTLKGNPAQQQAVINNNITSWKMHTNDVVLVNWVPNKEPVPGISGSQLDIANAHINRVDDNVSPVNHPAGSLVLCLTNNGGDGKAYVSSIFAPGNEDHRVFEAAFNTYLATKFGQHAFPYCLVSAEPGHIQGVLQSAKNQAPGNGIKLIETGWVYKANQLN